MIIKKYDRLQTPIIHLNTRNSYLYIVLLWYGLRFIVVVLLFIENHFV